LCWVHLWCELSLSTKGFQSIPHEITDQVESWSRVWKPMFFLPLQFPGDLLGLRQWSSRSSLPTQYWSSLQSFKSFRGVLIEFWAWNRFFPRAARKYQTCPVLISDVSGISNFRVLSWNLVETFPMVSRGYG
jgi:hypothetical protein